MDIDPVLKNLNEVELPIMRPKQRDDYRSFYLKKKTWQAICASRGWSGRGSIARFAESINITRQYAAELVNQNIGCSTNAMLKIGAFLGIKHNECLCQLFDRHREAGIGPDHPLYNSLKYIGETPYNSNSEMARLRSMDYETETRRA